MTLTPEQFKMRSAMEQAFKAQAAGVGAADINSLRACLTMAVQMAHTLQLPLKDLQSLCGEEHDLWTLYLTTKAAVIARRKAQVTK